MILEHPLIFSLKYNVAENLHNTYKSLFVEAKLSDYVQWKTQMDLLFLFTTSCKIYWQTTDNYTNRYAAHIILFSGVLAHVNTHLCPGC